MKIQVKDFMAGPVFNAAENATVGEVRKLMKNKKINSVPVVELKNRLPELERVIKGIVTASDLSSKVKNKTKITEVMSSKVHVIHKNSSAKSAAKMMLKHKVHHLLVMDDGDIIGMISSMDFVKLVKNYDLA
jgi:CBS domain-containing protein